MPNQAGRSGAMTDTEQQELGVLAKSVLVVGVALIIAGVIRYGVALATIQRVWWQLIERPTGPMAFRFILQPLMAAAAAIRDGRRDAKLNRAPYFWTMLYKPEERTGRLHDGLNATARIILLGLVMDAAYQVVVFGRFYPVEAVVIALALAFLSYVLLRGIVLRIARRWLNNAIAHGIR
jgi:hypothetical protein